MYDLINGPIVTYSEFIKLIKVPVLRHFKAQITAEAGRHVGYIASDGRPSRSNLGTNIAGAVNAYTIIGQGLAYPFKVGKNVF